MRFPLKKVIKFAMTNPREVDRGYGEFFGSLPFEKLKTEWEELFLEWLIFDFKQTSGTTFLIEYLLKNPDRLPQGELRKFEQITQTHFYSSFEIRDIKPGDYFILEDLFSGKTYHVYEKKGTESIAERGTIPGRIAQVDNRWYLVGANSVYFPMTHTDRAKKHLRQLNGKNYSPKDTLEILMQPSSPKPPVVIKEQIGTKRQELEQTYKNYTKQYGIRLSFVNLLSHIYHENRVNVLDFWKSLVKKGLPEKFMFEQFQILQDIWNYFPHKCLNDLSPIEVYQKMKEVEE